jgi:signal peptidase I
MNKNKILSETRSLFIIVLIALTLKVTLIEAYIVPTGSMEKTIMVGDFLIGNRFVYGMRTPDWIGIPYTDIGFSIPYYRFPEFKKPHQGDVIIFKYPRDPYLKYVKRCIAEPGDTLEIVNRKVYVNGKEFELPEHGRFIFSMADPRKRDPNIFLGKGNKDNFSQLVIPKKGDKISIRPETALLVMQLMLFDGHKLTLKSENQEYEFTTIDPTDLYRRKGSYDVFDDYYPNGNLINPWSTNMPRGELLFDGYPIMDVDEYIVKQNYYWAMGDNRDNSLDSRFWGFVPEDHILGEALFVYMSLNLDTWIPRFDRIGTIIE